MTIVLSLLATCFHAVLCFFGAPLLWGVVDKVRARLVGQPGPSLKQPYRHLAKLLSKTTLVPDTATDMFVFWPVATFLALAVVVMLIPGFCVGMLTAKTSDYITVMGLLVLGRAMMMLGGLETGSALGGAGVARMALSGLCAEAVCLLLLLVFAYLAQSTTLNSIAQVSIGQSVSLSVPMGFALAAMLVVAFTGAGYRPVGCQELGVVQDAVAMEYSGRLKALLDYAAMLRLLAWMNLLICLFVPFGIAHAGRIFSWPEGVLLWGAKLLCLSVGLAVFTVVRSEVRQPRVQGVLGAALFLGMLAVILLRVGGGG